MVITVKATTYPVDATSATSVLKGVVAEWHFLSDRASLCKRLVDEDSDRLFVPQGGRVCTECVNHLLRLVDLNKIGVPNAP